MIKPGKIVCVERGIVAARQESCSFVFLFYVPLKIFVDILFAPFFARFFARSSCRWSFPSKQSSPYVPDTSFTMSFVFDVGLCKYTRYVMLYSAGSPVEQTSDLSVW